MPTDRSRTGEEVVSHKSRGEDRCRLPRVTKEFERPSVDKGVPAAAGAAVVKNRN